eukprot:Skav229161  [mRNA]  locus=scaffold1381:177695:185693:+ [translate_table: standard]
MQTPSRMQARPRHPKRSIMMSMIIWDWLLARLLGRPIFGGEYDGQGWRDWHRALLLVVIMQFGSSVFVMMLVTLTHAIPALLIYYPVFLIASAFIIKFRSWLETLGVNPDGRAGRGWPATPLWPWCRFSPLVVAAPWRDQ